MPNKARTLAKVDKFWIVFPCFRPNIFIKERIKTKDMAVNLIGKFSQQRKDLKYSAKIKATAAIEPGRITKTSGQPKRNAIALPKLSRR